MADDWFRSPEWTDEARADFEKRLARARPHSRAQYLRIKGLAVDAAGDGEGARELWTRVLESPGVSRLQAWSALEHLGDSWTSEDPQRAESYYRQLLAENPTLNATTACVHLSLAELRIRRGDRASMQEAHDLLTTWISDFPSPFPSALFRFHLDLIAVAQALGDQPTVQQAARTALDLAGRGPVFPRHRDVGAVEADEATLERLHELAKSG